MGKKIIGKVILIICAIILLWFAASYIDVVLTNTTPEDVAPWNAFALLF